MVVMKRASKGLDINRRHSGGLTGLDRHEKRLLMEIMRRLKIRYDEIIENPAMARHTTTVATIPYSIACHNLAPQAYK